MNGVVNFLSAGAAQGLVDALRGRFEAETGATLQGRFGAVGAMKEALLAGEPCDLFIVTAAMVDALVAAGTLRGGTQAALGTVRTGIAVPVGERRVDVSTPEALKAALQAADAIYFPDPVRATAGVHFASVMRQLGIHDVLAPRLRTFPNGATAMHALAASRAPRQIGCTQITEIHHAVGVQLCGALPERFELSTVYSAAVAQAAAEPALAQQFIALLAGPSTRSLRRQGGFEL